MKTSESMNESNEILKAQMQAYARFKSKVQGMTYDLKEGCQECRVSHDKVIQTLNSLPPWLEENFNDMLNVLTEKAFYTSATALVQGYITKHSINALLESLDKKSKVAINEKSREFLLLFSIQQYMPGLCHSLMRDHNVTPHARMLVNDGREHGCDAAMIHHLKYDEKKRNEFLRILKALLEHDANIFVRGYYRLQGQLDCFFLPNLISQTGWKFMKEIRELLPVLYTKGLGLIDPSARFELYPEYSETKLNQEFINGLTDRMIMPNSSANRRDPHLKDMCDRNLINKMIASPIAFKVEMKDKTWRWVFTAEALQNMVTQDFDRLSPRQQRQIGHLFHCINAANRNGEIFLSPGVAKIAHNFIGKRYTFLFEAADNFQTLGFSKKMRDLSLSYLEEDFYIMSVVHELEKPTDNSRCTIL